MNREQAVNVIKEIFEQCRFIEGKSLKLMPPKENNNLSNTFQVCVQVMNDSLLVSCIESVAEKHNLKVKCKDSYCIVYKPYPNLGVV
jgi:hypothetical protein